MPAVRWVVQVTHIRKERRSGAPLRWANEGISGTALLTVLLAATGSRDLEFLLSSGALMSLMTGMDCFLADSGSSPRTTSAWR